ncbi:hypothetical protein B0T11DRAFT_144191 [Plectosphaerella cucumerina]|uniref:Gem-associated protein 5 TPR domain-containing protein n=1 Tax=Plectosphaerella cucumerina TaxID=40658 RepID=A0A8K0T7U2_9PEZI|nr:hypothetical protein B0T11DRAFT_144191 [Plectosphaerella cucumerina]
MSASASARNRNGTVSSSGRSSRAQGAQVPDFTMAPTNIPRFFDPCAATASMFLYAQGASIVCAHHDTLTIERRFSRHSDEVELLAVDNHSDRGAGRLVVSYDAGQTAIVWDLMTGDEMSRFASYEHLTTAAWMRSGNVAFGNTKGDIILFEPETSEHLSTRTLDQIAVTALAPASDNRTFAIGFQNGSLFIATVQPNFVVLHKLTTSRPPSPFVTLNWHASSSRQKSDMLAVQTQDGDLRVWSISKSHSSDDPAKVVRILKRNDAQGTNGPNWMAWSKNGRVIQFCDSQTLSWDVRTKHVTFDSIPTLEHVRGLAIYGPGATLFTLGANNTVQQFDLNAPSIIVANVQHPANVLPPSPPVSIEEQASQSASSVTTIATDSDTTGTADLGVSESDDDHLSPFARMVRHNDVQEAPSPAPADSYDDSSLASSRSGLSSFSGVSGGSATPNHYPGSAVSRTLTDGTYISGGSSLRSSRINHYMEPDLSSISSSMGMTLSSTKSRRRGSRLRNEVLRSPANDTSLVRDLFKFTRSRLSDIPYRHPTNSETLPLTNNDLRRQMLSTIFGWHKEMSDLVRDEMSRHPAGSGNRILLAKWLGDIDADVMAASSQSMTSSDWMLLALSGIGSAAGQVAQQKLGRAYVQRLLENGDIHAAATILIGMEDYNDAIEIYVSHRQYMEALILTCLFFPAVWERQNALIKKWGEWSASHGQQQLAIRCFACTDRESSEPWTSPSAVQVSFQSMDEAAHSNIPEILSPPLSPPSVNMGPQRSIAKTSALKLITSFGDLGGQKSKFFQGDEGQTPVAARPTPIAESAVSPGVNDLTTAFIRPSNRSQFNTPNSARSNTSGFSRRRLPSIGEVPSDLPSGLQHPDLPLPHGRMTSVDQEALAAGLSLQRAATASPMMMREYKRSAGKMREAQDQPPPNAMVTVKLERNMSQRNGSRDRIPKGVDLQLRSLNTGQAEQSAPSDASVTSSARFHWPRRRGPSSVSSANSQSTTGRSIRSNTTGGGTTGRSEFIHSLDAAQNQHKKARSRHSSREGRKSSRSRDRVSNRPVKASSRERSGERGRPEQRTWPKAKRSPTSPIPMSPEDLINLSTPRMIGVPAPDDPPTVRKRSKSRQGAGTGSRTSSRGSAHQRATEVLRHRIEPPALVPAAPLSLRGRSKTREGNQSPTSPIPMSASGLHYAGSEDEEDFKRALEAQEKFRNRHNRSTSTVTPRTSYSETKRERSQSRNDATRASPEIPREPSAPPREQPAPLKLATPPKDHAGDLKTMKDDRQRKKEQAALELEERRKSLAQRPLAPLIPHPSLLSPGLPQVVEAPATLQTVSGPKTHSGELRTMFARNNMHVGLPATPKAMRLIHGTDQSALPGVPPIPATFAQSNSPVASPKRSPNKAAEENLTLLPSTVYQPPSRPLIPRSVSAPPEKQPAFRRGSDSSSRPPMPLSGSRSHSRASSISKPESRGIDEMLRGSRRPSFDDGGNLPPPPPPIPAPPVLKELQHLAIPPPPPPAPLPHLAHAGGGGGLASGLIEIVMDEDEKAPSFPVPSSRGHSRGRSFTEREESKDKDEKVSSRLSKAAERFRNRSASRTRTRDGSRMRSPPMEGYTVAPYESVLSPNKYEYQNSRTAPYESIRDPERQTIATGLHESEMI